MINTTELCYIIRLIYQEHYNDKIADFSKLPPCSSPSFLTTQWCQVTWTGRSHGKVTPLCDTDGTPRNPCRGSLSLTRAERGPRCGHLDTPQLLPTHLSTQGHTWPGGGQFSPDSVLLLSGAHGDTTWLTPVRPPDHTIRWSAQHPVISADHCRLSHHPKL